MPTFTLLSLAALVALTAVSAARAAEPASAPTTQPYPTATLKSSTLSVMLYLPDPQHAFYRGSRFDGSGMIAQVQYAGHSFFSEWRIPHDPTANDHATATAEEFGMQIPLGYKDAKPGESFIKIGVGQEKRAKEDYYGFWTNYPITQYYPFEITSGPDWIQFVQTAPAHSGYAYTYTKKIALSPSAPSLTITRTLKNTGEKAIDTNWYCHNFTTIDNDPIGPNYTLDFPFPIQAGKNWAVAKVQGTNQLVFTKDIVDNDHALKGDFLTPDPNVASDNAYTISNTRTHAALKATGDFAVKKFGFFAAPRCLCPEPFLEIHLAPAEEKTWTTTYSFSAPEIKPTSEPRP